MRLFTALFLVLSMIQCSRQVFDSTSESQQDCISELVTTLLYSECDSLLVFLEENIHAVPPTHGNGMGFDSSLSAYKMLWWQIPGTTRSSRLSDTTIVKAFIRRECFEGLPVKQLLQVFTGDLETAEKFSQIVAETELLYGVNYIDLEFGNTYLGVGFIIKKGVVSRINFAHGTL